MHQTGFKRRWIVVGVLALLLLVISGMGFLSEAQNTYAASDCGILFGCTPTPTPRPSPSPSPTPTRVPTPRPDPTPRATPAPIPSPTAAASPTAIPAPTATAAPSPTASMAATPAGVKQTPGATPTRVPVTPRGNTRNRVPGPPGGVVYAVLAAAIVLCLLFSLLASRFILPRILLPQMDVKMPPSGAGSWSRRRIYDCDNQGCDDNARRVLAARKTIPELIAVNVAGTSTVCQRSSASGPDPVDFDEFSNRFELATSAFNIRYGLPEDPFASSSSVE